MMFTIDYSATNTATHTTRFDAVGWLPLELPVAEKQVLSPYFPHVDEDEGLGGLILA